MHLIKTSHCSSNHSLFCVLQMVVLKSASTIEHLIHRLQLRQVLTAKELQV